MLTSVVNMGLLRVLRHVLLLLTVVVRVVVVSSVTRGVRVGVLVGLRVLSARVVRRKHLGVSLTPSRKDLSEDEEPEEDYDSEEYDGLRERRNENQHRTQN